MTEPIHGIPDVSQGDLQMLLQKIKPNVILHGPVFPEPVQVLMVQPLNHFVKVSCKGLNSNNYYDPILSPDQIASLHITSDEVPFDGDAVRFRLGVEALRLGLAYEYDPYFTLSIARVDPLPHQLEAVYDYFLKLPRIRFLLADDPGAGKTIMAGLLLKELKIRGMIKRTLIVTPANLTFQWQREMQDKFRERFEVLRGEVLRSNYGTNPWQERNQVITSMPWVARIEDAKDSLLRSHWDLVIVDEAHKMSAYSQDHKTLAYQLGEALSDLTDHFLLMTATPHKGDTKNFSLFLRLLDKDVYADVKSLEEAQARHHAPFYLRRAKEAMVTFPDETGLAKSLFTRRLVNTVGFEIDSEELDLYYDLTNYVEEQSVKASQDDNTVRGRALGFTMAMLQRRFASSVYALRRSLERIKAKREKVLEDPEGYRESQKLKKVPDDFEDMTEEDQQMVLADLEDVVASVNPQALRDEIFKLGKLVDRCRDLEKRDVGSKLNKLRQVLIDQGIFKDTQMKMLIFTEHKDTLDYLAGDGKDGRPLGKLLQWGLSVTQIHGGMKIGDRNTPGTRINAEREFKESHQVMVATEAAGEGINLQFCWFMINYDIPWNPMRLEQRMGRIHRYGQKKDCLVFNFVSTNTREGRVLQMLFDRIERIERDLDPHNTGKVFNVLGDVLPSNQLEQMLREMYAQVRSEEDIKRVLLEEVELKRIQRITESALEGLAKKELNLSAILGKSEEAKEKRLVPEVIEDFFLKAAPFSGLAPKPLRQGGHIYRLGKTSRMLWALGEKLEPNFGKLGGEYKQITFDKQLLNDDPSTEWVTPGHPLFETVRCYTLQKTEDDLRSGAVFFDLHSKEPYCLDVYSAAVKDGLGKVAHRRLFVAQTNLDGSVVVRQPTIFHKLTPAGHKPELPDGGSLPGRDLLEIVLFDEAFQPFLEEVQAQRTREIETIERHMEISLNELIARENLALADYTAKQLHGNIKQSEDRLDILIERQERRREELQRERQSSISEVQNHGRAWVLPHPDRAEPGIAPMVEDEEIEKIAVRAVIAYEEARGWEVESVELDDRGFDLISRRPHAEDPKTFVEVRFIEVKGRSAVGEIALTTNEFRTAERLKEDYWLYVVFNCATNPEIHAIQNPAVLGWEPLVKIEHYHVGADRILGA